MQSVMDLRIRRRLASYVGHRERFWCSPYCALSFDSEAWRTRHRAVCQGFSRYSWERMHNFHRYGGDE